MFQIVPIAQIEPDAVDALLDRAFGSDRLTRTAYRVRSGTAAIPELSFAAVEQETVIASIQCWPVVLRCDDGDDVPMVMVGPVAVQPGRQQEGIGRALMNRMLGAAPGETVLMLIGDPEYYGRFFGFTAEHTARWRLPGPFESYRLLARGTSAPDRVGMVGPRMLAKA